MKKVFFATVAFLATLTLFSSCQKEPQDNERPVVELKAPTQGATLKIGGEHGVHFEMFVKDNVMLKSYKLEVHNNFDHHAHAAAFRDGNEKPFFFQKEYDLSGKKEDNIHHHDIVIPEDVQEGDYHLMVQVLDEAGNQTTVARDVRLSHEGEDHHDHDHGHGHDHDH